MQQQPVCDAEISCQADALIFAGNVEHQCILTRAYLSEGIGRTRSARRRLVRSLWKLKMKDIFTQLCDRRTATTRHLIALKQLASR